MSRRIARIESGRFAVDELSEAAEKAELLGLDSDGGQRRAQSELIEPLHRVRKEIEADPQLLELAGRFVDLGANPMLVKVERRRQAADAGADDHYMMPVHGSDLSNMSHTAECRPHAAGATRRVPCTHPLRSPRSIVSPNAPP